jgi:hypothetical protein
MSLPVAIRQAVSIAAAEVLFENLDAIASDPAAFLASGSLGATYQSFVGPNTFGADKVERWLAELAPWAPASADPSWRRLADAFEAAANDFARGLIFEATGAGAVPASVAPFVGELRGVVDALKQAIRDGAFAGDHEDII